MLKKYSKTESVQIFLDAMKNSPDPCQAQLCKEKSRAPPPLVPLSIALPFDDSVTPLNQINQDHLQNACMETLSELPCEVEIKEMNVDPILGAETTICEPLKKKCKLLDMLDTSMQMNTDIVSIFDTEEDTIFKADYQTRKEEKRTSILEQVLTGSLTMNNHQKLQPREKLTSEWWCAPCNSYYKTKDSLMKHMHLHCPRVYTCRKCSLSFDSVEILAKHEANNHLKVKLDFTEDLQDCHKCDRQFVSYEMLRQHRLRDHLAELTEIGTDTWCSLCNRFFPTVKSYQNHIQLHTHNQANSIIQKLPVAESVKVTERPKESKREEQFYENVKSLTCPTCGKVCTQQSALSNHMRTHEPKRHKCDICGRSFGLFIRLAAHIVTEHNVQPPMLPVLSAVEQEEALNAEREAREAREAKTRDVKNRFSSEATEKNNVLLDDESSTKRNSSGFKNVARCGICLLWFSDHTTMLTHLQTHSDNSHKNFVCHTCKKSFKEQSQLLRHETCHKRLTLENASLYISAAFNKSSSTDKTQQKMHTVDRTYHCAKCNKIFFKEVSLLTHQCTSKAQLGKKTAAKSLQKTSSYDTDKKYKCSKCDASFATSQSRNAHMRMHAEGTHSSTAQKHEIKVEKDDEPMPKLRPETSLEYNMSLIEPKIEINEQSIPPPLKRTLIKTANGHRCGVCQSPFVSRELAVAHLRSAHPVMPYQCPYCKKRFTTQYTFTHHIKTEHPDEPEK